MSLITIPYQNSIMDPGPILFLHQHKLEHPTNLHKPCLKWKLCCAKYSKKLKLWPKKTTLKKCCVYFMLLLLPVVQKSIN